MKSLFEQFGGTYRKENAYVIPNLEMPDIANFEIGFTVSSIYIFYSIIVR